MLLTLYGLLEGRELAWASPLPLLYAYSIASLRQLTTCLLAPVYFQLTREMQNRFSRAFTIHISAREQPEIEALAKMQFLARLGK